MGIAKVKTLLSQNIDMTEIRRLLSRLEKQSGAEVRASAPPLQQVVHTVANPMSTHQQAGAMPAEDPDEDPWGSMGMNGGGGMDNSSSV